MLVTKLCPLGGRKPTNKFSLGTDKEGNFGIKLGYVEKCRSCGYSEGDPIIMKMTDAEDIANKFGSIVFGFKKHMKGFKPYISVRERIAIWLIGKKKVGEYKEEWET